MLYHFMNSLLLCTSHKQPLYQIWTSSIIEWRKVCVTIRKTHFDRFYACMTLTFDSTVISVISIVYFFLSTSLTQSFHQIWTSSVIKRHISIWTVTLLSIAVIGGTFRSICVCSGWHGPFRLLRKESAMEKCIACIIARKTFEYSWGIKPDITLKRRKGSSYS